MCVKLENRVAKCVCGKTAASDDSGKLAYFEFQGEGSERGRKICKNCGMGAAWHTNKDPHEWNPSCDSFEAIGSFEFDSYYCGHAGWE